MRHKKVPFYIVADVEFSHADVIKGDIIELGAIAVHGETLEVMATFHYFARPRSFEHWNKYAEDKIHKIRRSFLEKEGLSQRELAIKFLQFLVPFKQEDNSPLTLVYHASNPVEYRFLEGLYKKESLLPSFKKVFHPNTQENTLKRFEMYCRRKGVQQALNLKNMTEYFGVGLDNHHRAIEDARATYECLKRMIQDENEYSQINHGGSAQASSCSFS